MLSNIRHSHDPIPMPCWFDGSNSLDAPAVDPVTAPHHCMMPDCPGPVNKRKLEAFEDLLAALEAISDAWANKSPLSWQPEGHFQLLDQARAAIARASPQAPAGPGQKGESHG